MDIEVTVGEDGAGRYGYSDGSLNNIDSFGDISPGSLDGEDIVMLAVADHGFGFIVVDLDLASPNVPKDSFEQVVLHGTNGPITLRTDAPAGSLFYTANSGDGTTRWAWIAFDLDWTADVGEVREVSFS